MSVPTPGPTPAPTPKPEVTTKATITTVTTSTDGVVPASGSEDSLLKLKGTLTAALTATQELSIYNGTQPLGKASVNGKDWTLNLTQPLSNADHSFTAKVIDTVTSTDVSTSDAYAVKVDAKYSLVANKTSAGGVYKKEQCVEDRVNGLIWEGKESDNAGTTAATNPRGFKTTYKNEVNVSASDNLNSAWYVDKMNTEKLCGFGNWSLPTKDQLLKLVDATNVANPPAINQNWFPHTVSSFYWTNEPGNYGTIVFFDDGTVDDYNYRDDSRYVRLVRASQ